MSSCRPDVAEPAASAAVQVLKVLAGVQKGAEIVLAEQLYTIGSDENCKIVLLEEGVAAVHIQAAYLNGNLSILECQNDVHIDGKPVGNPPVAIASGQLISFGSMLLSFGERGQDWDRIAEGARRLADAADRKEGKPGRPPPPPPGAHRRSWRLLALAVPAAALGLGIVGGGDSDNQGASKDAPAADNAMFQMKISDPVTEFKAWLASEQQLSEVFFIEQGDSGVLVGLVDEPGSLISLRKMSSDIGPRWRVAQRSQLLEDLRLSLAKFDAGLIYELSASDGVTVLQLGGFARAIEDSADLVAVVRDNFPVIDEVEVTAVALVEIIDQIEDELGYGLEYAGIEVEADEQTLTVSGTVLANYEQQLADLLAQLFASYQPHSLALDFEATVGPYFDGKVTSVLIGANTAAVIDFAGDETSVAVGDEVEGGFVIQQIESNLLELLHEGRIYHFPVN